MNASTKSSSDISSGFALGYLYKTIKDELNSIAATTGGKISALKLAGWLANLLSAETDGSVLGSTKHLPQVWGRPTKGNGTASEETVHVRPHGRRTLSRKARKKISDAQKARWAKVHKEKKGEWTSKRRREQAARMKKLQPKLQKARLAA